ncbi:unnamed protein product [Polarella glacialis]|uniref:Uncharacterized protein n=1 Tax=Polarella glacialis TaxID=89957 RepID=A0A813FFQ4_POLGL|nr:unnamed protein product [Polarella glacialis]
MADHNNNKNDNINNNNKNAVLPFDTSLSECSLAMLPVDASTAGSLASTTITTTTTKQQQQNNNNNNNNDNADQLGHPPEPLLILKHLWLCRAVACTSEFPHQPQRPSSVDCRGHGHYLLLRHLCQGHSVQVVEVHSHSVLRVSQAANLRRFLTASAAASIMLARNSSR